MWAGVAYLEGVLLGRGVLGLARTEDDVGVRAGGCKEETGLES